MDGGSTERKYLKTAVAGALLEIGFHSAQPAALETLVEMLNSVLLQMGNNSRRYAELAGRLEPLGADVMMSLIDMGLFTSVSSLLAYAKRSNRAVLPNPGPSIQPQVPSSLQSGTRMTHPSYMPSHMPLFPDSQTYIRTPTHSRPVTEYQAIREKSAALQHELKTSVINFLVNTSPTESLFFDQENDCFPLLANKPVQPAYLSALLPNDQIFDDNFELPSPCKKSKTGKKTQIKCAFHENEQEEVEEHFEVNNNDGSETEEEPIDSPFLRLIKKR